jgi:hypothetical protein
LHCLGRLWVLEEEEDVGAATLRSTDNKRKTQPFYFLNKGTMVDCIVININAPPENFSVASDRNDS